MKIFQFLILLMVSVNVYSASLNDFYYSMPALICHDEQYLRCHEGISSNVCTKQAKKFREVCSGGKEIETMEELKGSMACLILKHSKVETIEDFESKCNGGMNINISEAKRKIKAELTQDQIDELLL